MRICLIRGFTVILEDYGNFRGNTVFIIESYGISKMLVATVFIRGCYSVCIGFIVSYLSISLIRAFTVVFRGKRGMVRNFFK